MIEEAFLVGRLLFAFLLVGSGIGHLTATAAMAGYAELRGVRNATQMVQVSGVALIAGGASIGLGIVGDLGSLGVAVLMLVTAVMMHAFWKESDPAAKQQEMVQFNKDVALAGGALVLYAAFRVFDAFGVGYTLVDSVLS